MMATTMTTMTVALTTTRWLTMTMQVTALALGKAAAPTTKMTQTVVVLVEALTTMMMTTTSHPVALAASTAPRTMMASTIRPSTDSCRHRAATSWNQPVVHHVARKLHRLPAQHIGSQACLLAKRRLTASKARTCRPWPMLAWQW